MNRHKRLNWQDVREIRKLIRNAPGGFDREDIFHWWQMVPRRPALIWRLFAAAGGEGNR